MAELSVQMEIISQSEMAACNQYQGGIYDRSEMEMRQMEMRQMNDTAST
jgi:hypothetical protein